MASFSKKEPEVFLGCFAVRFVRFLGRAERGDVVLAIDGEGRHNHSPWCHAMRGHDIDHSEVLEKQGNFDLNLDLRGSAGRRGMRCRKWQKVALNGKRGRKA